MQSQQAMPDDTQSLDAKISALRDLTNEPRRQALLLADRRNWRQLCSCMDAIGDAEYALDAHAALRAGETEPLLYLAHFGFVQALYLQQEAVENLCKTLGFPDLADCVRPELEDVRDIRNDVAHMTNREWGTRFVGIVRISMTPTTFERYSFSELDDTHSTVDCAQLAERQHAVLAEVLDMVLERIRDDEREHRERFRTRRLSDGFRRLSDETGRIAKGARSLSGSADRTIAESSLRALVRSVDHFAHALSERGLGPGVNAYVDLEVADARAALVRMGELFSERSKEIDAEAMVLLVQQRMNRMAELANSYDATYAEEP